LTAKKENTRPDKAGDSAALRLARFHSIAGIPMPRNKKERRRLESLLKQMMKKREGN
jgi:hypothetical protein